jgi:hypothetical protein
VAAGSAAHQIAGIVTIADLQKLAVLVLLTHLELLMAAAIRAHFRERPDDEWLVMLGDRRQRVEQKWQKLKASGREIDRIAATQFADKRRILVKSGLVRCSRPQAEREAVQLKTCETAWPMPMAMRRQAKAPKGRSRQ